MVLCWFLMAEMSCACPPSAKASACCLPGAAAPSHASNIHTVDRPWRTLTVLPSPWAHADTVHAAAQPAGQGAAVEVVHDGEPEGARKDHPGADADGTRPAAQAMQLPGLEGHQGAFTAFSLSST